MEMMGTSFTGPFMHRPAQGKYAAKAAHRPAQGKYAAKAAHGSAQGQYAAKAAHGPRGKQGENIPCQLKRSVFEAYRRMDTISRPVKYVSERSGEIWQHQDLLKIRQGLCWE